MNTNNDKEQRKFYIALYSTVAVVAAAAFLVSVNNKSKKPEENLTAAVEETTEFAAAEPVNRSNVKSYKEQTTAAQSAEEKAAETTQKQLTEKPSETTTQTKTAAQSEEEPQYTLFDDSKEMSWPVNGKIVMDYSVETAVYDKTLDQYRTNDSICISADVGDTVVAAASGVVEQIFNSNEKGNTVVINHGNGWLTTYSQLGENIAVAEGQVVQEGENIGCVGQPSNYGIALGSHLEFTVSKDNETADPKLLLAQLEE